MSFNQRRVRHNRPPGINPSHARPKKPMRWRKVLRPVGYILVVVFVLYLLIGLRIFEVRKISTTGNQSISSSEIDRQTRAVMKQTILGSNWLFTNTKSIAAALKSQNYQFGTVVVKKSLPTNLVIQIDERQPSLIWKSGDKAYVLSEEGRAFTVTGNSARKLPQIVDQTNLPVELGSQIVPKNFIIFTRSIFAGLSQLGLEIEQASVTESTSELYVKTKKGYIVKFDTDRSADSQISDLKALLTTLKSQSKQPMEYIDLRIPQKVFYK